MADTLKLQIMPGLPREAILERYRMAAGRELDSKFNSPESSSNLVANGFGYFLADGRKLTLPVPKSWGAVAGMPLLEQCLRFPWRGGRHPWLDAVCSTSKVLIGIESKRYEPFRGGKPGSFSDAYWRPGVWGTSMKRWQAVRDAIRDGDLRFEYLDATQLIKHSLGLRTAVHRKLDTNLGKKPVLLYLYSEPKAWPTGKLIDTLDIEKHRDEVQRFARLVKGDEVGFVAMTWRDLLACWKMAADAGLAAHVAAVRKRFDVG